MTPEEEIILDKIKKNPVFSALVDDRVSLSILLKQFSRRSFKKGEVIVKEGDSGSELFILFHGAVDLVKRTPAGDTYNVETVSDDENFFFGETGLIKPERYDITVVARYDSDCLILSGESFKRISSTHPSAGLPVVMKIAEILADRVRKVQNDMMTLYDALVHEIKS